MEHILKTNFYIASSITLWHEIQEEKSEMGGISALKKNETEMDCLRLEKT